MEAVRALAAPVEETLFFPRRAAHEILRSSLSEMNANN